MDTSEPITIVIIAIVVIIVLFLLFREINCWYWKINERIGLIKRTNILLERIYIQLGGVLDKENKVSFDEKLRGIAGLDVNIYDNLSIKEKEELNWQIAYAGIANGDIIALNKRSRKIRKFSLKQWKEVINGMEWIIIIDKTI